MQEIIQSIQSAFTSFTTSFAEALPKLIGGIILIIIGWILASLLARLIRKLLETLRVDELGEKLKEVPIFAGLDFKISQLTSKLVYWMVFFIALIMATETMGMTTMSQSISSFMAYIPKVLSAAIFFFIGTFFANVIRNFIVSATTSMNIPAGRIIGSFVFYFLVLMFGITALNQAGMETTIITENIKIILGAFMLAIGLGYGLSSKDLMGNMLASFYTNRKFTEGQRIKYLKTEGEILSLDNNSAVILKDNGNKVVIPLSRLMQEEVEILQETIEPQTEEKA